MKSEDAWELRERVREHSLAPVRTQRCGIGTFAKVVELRTDATNAWWHGVVRCRARICPVCWLARRFEQAGEVAWVVTERERETRQQSFLCTLTVRHQVHHETRIARDVRAAWRAMLQSRAWRTFVREHGCEWIVAEEITRGDHGWHPHLHALLMPRERIDLNDPWSAAWSMHDLWCRFVERKLGAEHLPSREHGCDLRPCDSHEYLTKVGLELADPGAQKGRAPLALLSQGELDMYIRLQRARTRARDITYSRGLRSLRSEYENSAPPVDFGELAALRGSDWYRLVRTRPLAPLRIAKEAREPETAHKMLIADLGDYYRENEQHERHGYREAAE